MSDDLINGVRQRLIEISDELQALPADDFPGKHLLNTEADGLRRQLDGLTVNDAETLRRWAGLASTKNRRTDDATEAAKAILRAQHSHHDSGGSS